MRVSDMLKTLNALDLDMEIRIQSTNNQFVSHSIKSLQLKLSVETAKDVVVIEPLDLNKA